jgi:RHS repeat-associated protein
MPTCSHTTQYRSTSYSARYTFSGKERDEESGFSYFGARYYNSSYSIWLSVDPMADKYPSISPYAYCGNNPIKLVDPNGEDYEVVKDDEKKTITIKATYYAANPSDYTTLQKGLKAWNNQSEKYSLYTENGSYTIKFELSGMLDEDGYKKASRETNENRGPNYNSFKTDPAWKYGDNFRGITQNGHQIHVKTTAPMRTVIHEIGHTLGLGEFGGDNVMTQGGYSDVIGKNHVMQILATANIQCTGTFSGGVQKTTPYARVTRTNYVSMTGAIKQKY